MGAVLNLRPDLARAALLRVPFVDVINTMLDESLPLTVGEFEEWGNPKIREHYDCMKTYCPYTNLGPRAYPRILVRTSINDSQVMYWEPAKWIAKLRARGTAGGAAAVQDQHGGRPRRLVRPLRCAARAVPRLHLGARRARPRARRRCVPIGRNGLMKIARVEHLHADAGQRNFDFLKLTTDDGLVGWSEYNESFGGLGVSAVIDGLAPLSHRSRRARLGDDRHPALRGAAAGLRRRDPAGHRRHRERAARREGQGARGAGLRIARRTAARSHPSLLVALRDVSPAVVEGDADPGAAYPSGLREHGQGGREPRVHGAQDQRLRAGGRCVPALARASRGGAPAFPS